MLKNQVRITASCDVLTVEGDLVPLDISNDYSIEYLICLGHLHQEDVCSEMEEQLNELYETNSNYLGASETYFSCTVSKLEEIELKGNEFSPKLRGLHGRTN